MRAKCILLFAFCHLAFIITFLLIQPTKLFILSPIIILYPLPIMSIFRFGCVALLCVSCLLTHSESFTAATPRAARAPVGHGVVPRFASFASDPRNTNTNKPIHSILAAESSSSKEPSERKNNKLPMLLDVGTKGGALFLSLVLFCVPLVLYQVVTRVGGVDQEAAGVTIGVGFTSVLTLGWASTLLMRVVNKDMTYVSDGAPQKAKQFFLRNGYSSHSICIYYVCCLID
jgi:hypothetical protein